MSPERREPAAGLPAAYESPWRRLGADLVAVAASLRLRLRELLRRNAAAELPRPGFWPASLAALFWPLLLLLLVALFGGLGLRLVLPGPLAPPSPEQAPAAADAPGRHSMGEEPAAAGRSEPAGDKADEADDNDDADPAAWPSPAGGAGADSPPPGADQPPNTTQPPAVPPEAGGPVAAAGLQAAAPDAAQPPPLEPSAEELLQRALQADDPHPWFVALELRAPESLLRATITPGFTALAEQERSRLASLWLERARSLGYERLELCDLRGRLLGRPALVGSGMILLDSPPAPS